MRNAYHEELSGIGRGLVDMARFSAQAVERATAALLDSDLPTAEQIIAEDARLDGMHHDLENRAITLLARQQPVATDLRLVVTSLRMGTDLERAGDLAQHVAKLTRLRYPESVIPQELRPIVRDMGRLAKELMLKTAEVLDARDVDLALTLEGDDDQMDLLHRELFQHMIDGRWKHGIETAVDVTLCGRYYERFADHAVEVAKRVVFLVTGEHADDFVVES
ncbi:phosphate signaling complex protein PhoU [Allostreptomyces psammosilenae]|uniref:Phosphate-specific transport system accessory protein PhoU n=1 Tax=Allostreptomyces psammosilenae TaxID=1892865 RepID=A0A853A3U8_9ACTN|nr:phosphate signaling complex protein PhoU [Allostreptomyces psammosilenae]NYI07554.1 phosphate transport system protein [Allostreptomyces psammosilenae]